MGKIIVWNGNQKMNLITGCCLECDCPPTVDQVKAAVIATPLITYTADFISTFDGLVHGMGNWVAKALFYTPVAPFGSSVCAGAGCGPTACPLEVWSINKHVAGPNNTQPGRLMPWSYYNSSFNPPLDCGYLSLNGNHESSTYRPYFCGASCNPCQPPYPIADCGQYVQGLEDTQLYTVNGFNSTQGMPILDNVSPSTLPQVATLYCPPVNQIPNVPLVNNIASKKVVFTDTTNPLAVQTVTIKKQIRLYSWQNNFPYPPEGETVNVGKCLALVFGAYVKATRPWWNVTTQTGLNPNTPPDDLTYWVTYISYWNGTDTAAQWLAKPVRCNFVEWEYLPCPFGPFGMQHFAMAEDESTYLMFRGYPMYSSGFPPCGIGVIQPTSPPIPETVLTGIGCAWSDVQIFPFLGVVNSATSTNCFVNMNPVISPFQPNLSLQSQMNIT